MGGGESEKLKQGVVQEAGVFKKGGGRGLALSLFNFFKRLIIFTFRNYFYPLQNCVTYAFEEKKFFFCRHKGHSTFLKNKPENIPNIKITYL